LPHQEALTVVATIKPGHVEAVENLLGTIKDHVDTWDIIPFAELAHIHFARLVVFNETTDLNGHTLPARLTLMTNVDAPLEAHIKDLAGVCGTGLDAVFGHCEAYPESSERVPATRETFLRDHMVRHSAFYVNRQGRTVQQSRQEDELRRAIDDYLNAVDLSGQSPESVHASIVDFVRRRSDLSWALTPAAGPTRAWRVTEALHQVGIIVAVLVLSPLLLVLLPLFVILLRYYEQRDVPDTVQASADAVRTFRADEDYWVQNQIIAVGLFKPGWFRWLTARAILMMTDYACRHIYNRGSLSGLNTIHFARWVPLDEGQRLFFSSNYDGSLESYMNDFIDKAAWGLNAIFSNGDGFPRTAFLFCGGITDEIAYKRFLPTRQVQSRVWYSAYPHLSTKNIANNAEIRRGLSDTLDLEGVKMWLRRFGVGNQLPVSGVIARCLDSIRWDQICRFCT
jgi:hypothetical protein